MIESVELTRNQVAIVDSDDMPRLLEYKWRAHKNEFDYTWYAISTDTTAVLMHRYILRLSVADECLVDHINGNGLDNRKTNLRLCTNSQNQMNRRKQRGGTSRFKGVSWDSSRQRWTVRLVNKNLGRFDNEEEAARVYDLAAIEAFGAFEKTNKALGLL